MYSIRWNGTQTVVGKYDDIMYLANKFETLRIYYKIAMVSVGMVSQEQMGLGYYKYWLDPSDIFTSPMG